MEMQNFTKKLFYSFATAALLATVACSSDKEDVLGENSKIEIKNFDVNVSEGDTTLTFVAAANWRATLNTTSWIEIDPMTKGGAKGDATIILKWKATSAIKERTADLTIAVDNENPVVIRITQLPNAPIVISDKTESILKVDKKAANGRGLFCDTLTIKSNIKWAVKNKAEWFDFEYLGDKDSQDGVQTTIQLVLKGKPALYNAPEMVANLVIGGTTDANDQVIPVKAVSYLDVVNASDETLPLTQVVFERSAATGNRYVGRLKVNANTTWELLNLPEWASSNVSSNKDEYSKNLNTAVTVSFSVNDNSLDTEAMSGKIQVKDQLTGLKSDVELVFPGTGDDFFESKLQFTPDFKFHASSYTPNWEFIEDAVLSWDFDMVSAKNYTSLDNAPFTFHFVHVKNMRPMKMEASWLFVDMVQPTTRAALNTKPMSLSVIDRNMGMDFLNGLYEERSAYMIVVPAGVQFDDMFDENDDLKEEYFEIASLVIQQGVTLPKPDTNMPDYYRFDAKGGKSDTYEVTNFDMVSTYVNGEPLDTNFWVSIEFERDENYSPYGIRVVAAPNTTGKDRTCKITMTNYVEATDSEEHVITFTVSQAGE